MTTIRLSRSGLPCAWCLSEQGVQASPNDSHGICTEHLAKVRAEIAQRAREAMAEPLITCSAEYIGDVARFLLAVEALGVPQAIVCPSITQGSPLEDVAVSFRSAVPLAELRDLARALKDAHHIVETLRLNH